jgi:methionine-rich copper-binding protein CopC
MNLSHLRSTLAIGAAILAISAVLVPPALAHTDVYGSNPADGAIVDSAPEEVWVQFGNPALPVPQPMAINGGDLEVYDPCGEKVSSGETEMNDQQNQLTIVSGGNRAGRYELIWTAQAIDGAVQSGLIDFNVSGGETCTQVSRRDSLKDVDFGFDIKSVKATPSGGSTKVQVKLKKPITCKSLGKMTKNGLELRFDRNADDSDDYTGSFACRQGRFVFWLTEAESDAIMASYKATLTPKGNVLTTTVKTADLGDGEHLDLYATSYSEANECEDEPAEGETATVCADRAPDLGVLRAF